MRNSVCAELVLKQEVTDIVFSTSLEKENTSSFENLVLKFFKF